MKRLLSLLLILIAFASATPLADAHSVWRETNRYIDAPSLVDPATSDGVEIFGINGSIIVRTNHKVNVQVFTILGQLVSKATLPQGTSEFKTSARGIYIVKIGNITQKVAL